LEQEVTDINQTLTILTERIESIDIATPIVEELNEGERLSMSNQEYRLLCKLVDAEAGVCDYSTRRAIASVVINRLHSSSYPNTITEVIYQKNQFSVIDDDSLDDILYAKDSTEDAVDEALDKDYIDGATAFYVHALSGVTGQNWFRSKIDSGEYILVAKMDKDVEFFKESGD